MYVEKLPSGSYKVKKQIDGKRHSLTFDHKPTKKEIEQRVNEIKNSSVTLSNAPRKTFEQCANEYLSVKSNVLSASTVRSYNSYLNMIPDEFKKKPMSEIDQLAIQKYINDLSSRRSAKTAKNYHGFISVVMKTFIKGTDLHTTLPRQSVEEEYVPTTEEVQATLAQCKLEKYRICFMLGANGLRRSEVLALTLDDVKDDYVIVNKAKVYTKEKKWIIQHYNKTDTSTRNVPINEELSKAIHKQGFIYNGHPSNILEYLHSCQKRAGVPEFKFHSLRHYYATELLPLVNAGIITSKDLQKNGGWKSDYVLKRVYQHERISKDKEKQQLVADYINNLLKNVP